MERRAKVTSKGQITIPKAVREALGVRAGDSIVFEVDDSGARVRTLRKPISFADYAGAWREGRGMNMEEVNAYVRDLRGRGDEGRGG